MGLSRITLIRCGVWAGALCFSGLAVINGMDRLSVTHPAIAWMVPEPFAVNALAVRAQESMVTSPKEAVRLATKLVGRAPIEPDSTALLGQAYLAAGDSDRAERAFRIASQLGWHIPITQDYWLSKDLEAKKYGLAVIRLDALLRLLPNLLKYDSTLVSFENNSDARLELVGRLATRPPWLSWYIGADGSITGQQLARRVPSLMLLADRGVVLGCDAIKPTVQRLQSEKFVKEAEALQRGHCATKI